MKRSTLALALSAAIAVTPAALAQATGGPHHPAHPAHPTHAKGPKGLNHLTQACAVADADAYGVDVRIMSMNNPMRRALFADGSYDRQARLFHAQISGDTAIRLVGKARFNPGGPRLSRVGTYANLSSGDLLTIRYRAPRGTMASDLGPARIIIDHGPSVRCGQVARHHRRSGDRVPEPKSQAPRGANHLLNACVVSDAQEYGVDLKVLHANAIMRRSLFRDSSYDRQARAFSAEIGPDTFIRLVGRARFNPDAHTLLPKVGGYQNLTAGDWVTVRYRAPRTTNASDLGPAWRIIDHGPRKVCLPAVQTPPGGTTTTGGSGGTL